MSVWLIRAGSHGEYEQKFLQERKVYVTWDDLDVNLGKLKERSDLMEVLNQRYPDKQPKAIQNWVSQIWPFVKEIKKGDLIVLPLKSQRAVQIGEVVGEYQFNRKGPSPYFHWRQVKWIGDAIPRAHFGKDILNTFGAFLTICRVKRNNAEERIKAMRANGWEPESISAAIKPASTGTAEAEEATDIEVLAGDQIAQLISARFKGHGLTRLVEAILKAQGYTTYRALKVQTVALTSSLVLDHWVLVHQNSASK